MNKLISKIRTIWAEMWKVKLATFWDSICIQLGADLGKERFYQFQNGWKLKYDPNTLDNMVIRECLTNSLYTKFLKEKNLKNVVDLGAHKGFFALGLMFNGYKFKKMLMVEPLVENLVAFKENLKMNDRSEVRRKIVVENCAVGDKNGKAKFFVTRNSVNHSLLDPSSLDEVVSKIDIKVAKLGTILEKNKIREIDLLKMDIEGAEFNLLKSDQLKYILKAKRIVMEVHPGAHGDGEWVKELFEKYRYRVSWPNPAYRDLMYMEKV